MFEHLRIYAKAYSAGAGAFAAAPFAGDITNILVWILSLAHVPALPPAVQTSITNVITGLAAGLLAAFIPNAGPSK